VAGPSLANVVTFWPAIARLARAEVLAVRRRDFVAAALASGAAPVRILLRHVLPNALAPILVTASVLVATAILTEAGLAFLSPSDPNLVTWGG
jgi:peptide/nickel transport system permease protein